MAKPNVAAVQPQSSTQVSTPQQGKLEAAGEDQSPASAPGPTSAPSNNSDSMAVDKLRAALEAKETEFAVLKQFFSEIKDDYKSLRAEQARARARIDELVEPRQPTSSPSAPGDELCKIVNLRAGPLEIALGEHGLLKLVPGVNTPSAKQWAKAKEHPHIRHLLQVGLLPNAKEGLRDLGDGSGLGGVDDLTSLLAVERSTSVAQLEGWAQSESRPGLKMAIQARIGQVERSSREFTERAEAARESGKTHGK